MGRVTPRSVLCPMKSGTMAGFSFNLSHCLSLPGSRTNASRAASGLRTNRISGTQQKFYCCPGRPPGASPFSGSYVSEQLVQEQTIVTNPPHPIGPRSLRTQSSFHKSIRPVVCQTAFGDNFDTVGTVRTEWHNTTPIKQDESPWRHQMMPLVPRSGGFHSKWS